MSDEYLRQIANALTVLSITVPALLAGINMGLWYIIRAIRETRT